MNKNKFLPIYQETVVELTVSTGKAYVFPANGAHALTRIEASVKGSEPLFLKAFTTSDRQGDFRYINTREVPELKVITLQVPTRITDMYPDAMSEDTQVSEEARRVIKNYFETK